MARTKKPRKTGTPSPVMGLSAAVKNEAIKVSCDVEGKDIFAVLGSKKKNIPMKSCAAIVNDEFSRWNLHGVTLMRNNVSVVDASKALITANNNIFKDSPVSAKYMESFIKQKCNEKNGKVCPI